MFLILFKTKLVNYDFPIQLMIDIVVAKQFQEFKNNWVKDKQKQPNVIKIIQLNV